MHIDFPGHPSDEAGSGVLDSPSFAVGFGDVRVPGIEFSVRLTGARPQPPMPAR
jgi:hypothetical protein